MGHASKKQRTRQDMNRHAIIAVAGLATGLLLAACDRPPSLGPGEADFGNAVRHNMAAQAVNPAPMPESGNAPYDGSRAQRGIQRYKADEVKQPRELRTSPVGQATGG